MKYDKVDERETKKRSTKKNPRNRRPKGSNSKEGRDERKEYLRDKKDNNGEGALVNDPTWYFSNPTLAEQAAQFSFSNFAGRPITWYAGVKTPDYSIMRLKYIPSPQEVRLDDSSTYMTGLNYASRKWYTALSSMTGRTSSYAPPDIAIMFLAMGELITMSSVIRRAFGLAYTTTYQNRNYPDAIIETMGIDPLDLKRNLANYRERFNTLISAMNKIPVPAGITYFDKCATMYSNIYTDSDAATAGSYVQMPASTWILDEAYDTNGSGLRTRDIPTTGSGRHGLATMSDWIDLFAEMVEAMVTSSTLSIVYADILNYASKNSLQFLTFNIIDMGYSVVPTYNLNALLQIHNTHIVNAASSTSVPTGMTEDATILNDVCQNMNALCIKYSPIYKWHSGATQDSFVRNMGFVDMLTPTASEADRIDATRYVISINNVYTIGDTPYMNYTHGDHTCVGVDVLQSFDGTTYNDAGNQILQTGLKSYIPVLDSALSALLGKWEAFSHFDWAPIGLINHVAGYANRAVLSIVGDINYYTTIEDVKLRNMNTLAEQSLFDLR